MPKITSINSKGPLIRFFLKSVILTVFSVAVTSMLLSLLVYKVDLDIRSLEYLSYVSVCISSLFISYFSVKPLKNNGFVMGMLSSLPLVIYSFVNLISHGNNIIHYLIKLLLILVISGIFGYISASKSKKFKVK